MSDLLSLIVIVLIAFAIAALAYWLFIASEGVYLGRRVVIWLYDVYANRYDGIKQYRSDAEEVFLAQPLMEQIEPKTDPLVLDVATGTGRLPLALANHAGFRGRVIGVDLSIKMLRIAEAKLRQQPSAIFVHAPAEALPFPDESFDVVTCLEAIEFMTQRAPVLAELMRVLRPGGLLLITNRINTKLMPGKIYTRDDLVAELGVLDAESILMERWQYDYDLAWVKKSETPLVADM